MTEQGPTYKPGDQVNNYVFTGTEWLPIATPPAPKSASPWRLIAGVVCLVAGGLAGLQALSWIASFSDLDSQGNQFAGILAVLGMGGAAVAVAFGVTGILLLTRK
jgi:hypothetical protein